MENREVPTWGKKWNYGKTGNSVLGGRSEITERQGVTDLGEEVKLRGDREFRKLGVKWNYGQTGTIFRIGNFERSGNIFRIGRFCLLALADCAFFPPQVRIFWRVCALAITNTYLTKKGRKRYTCFIILSIYS